MENGKKRKADAIEDGDSNSSRRQRLNPPSHADLSSPVSAQSSLHKLSNNPAGLTSINDVSSRSSSAHPAPVNSALPLPTPSQNSSSRSTPSRPLPSRQTPAINSASHLSSSHSTSSRPPPFSSADHTPLHAQPRQAPAPYAPSQRVKPWAASPQWTSESTAMDMLTTEIGQFVEEVSPEASTHYVREMIIQCLRNTIQSLRPDAKIIVYGSHVTLLYLPDGDIDITIIIPGLDDNFAKGELLRTVLALLLRLGMVSDVNDLSRASKPLITFNTVLGGIPIDLSVNSVDGFPTIDFIKSLLQDIPVLRPLVMTCKALSFERGINVSFKGGMGSYVLTLLVAHFLKWHPMIRKREVDPFKNLGVLLYDLLTYYAKDFQSHSVGLSFSDETPFFWATDKTWASPLKAEPLWIESPLNSELHLAGSTEYIHIRDAFAKAAKDMDATLTRRHNHLEAFRTSVRGDSEQKTKIVSHSMLGDVLTLSERMMVFRDNLRKLYTENTLQRHFGYPLSPYVPDLPELLPPAGRPVSISESE